MFNRTGHIKTLPPAGEVPLAAGEEFPLDWLQAPVVTGLPLTLFLLLAEGPMAGPLRRQLMRQNNLPQILEEIFIPERATYQPNLEDWPAEPATGLEPLAAEGSEGQLSGAGRAAAAAAVLAGSAGFSSLGQDRASGQAGAAGADASTGAGVAGISEKSAGAGRQPHTAADFFRAYSSGRTTPAEVAERVIAAVAASEAQDPPMRLFISHEPERLRQLAAASAQRWAEGRPLSPLDGVPFAVKDCVDALPYPTTAGTGFMADWRAPTQSLAGVQALLDAGALLVGKTTLHEIGLGTTGLNTVTGTARNPHSPAHHTGGSSSGSAALVAAGICPFAVGTDGGGSIRIPAALCGVVGLKPTHARVGTENAVPPIDQTVAVAGPIAGSVQDCALMYACMANLGHPEGASPLPPITLPAALPDIVAGSGNGADTPLAGKKAGVHWKWFDQAAPAVADACRAALRLLEARGLEVVPLDLPELGLLRAAHTCTIVSEMRNNMSAALLDAPTRRLMNAETRVSLSMGGAGFTAGHYVQAQKIRTRVEAHFRRAFERCDFIVTPTLPCTAPPINPAALRGGTSDLTTTTALMHFVLAPNFIGLPAISVPVGAVPSTNSNLAAAMAGVAAAAAGTAPAAAAAGATGHAGGSGGGPLLPVGLQIMAPCWHEGALLHAGAVLEAAVAAAGQALPLPPVWYDVLAGEVPAPSAGAS